MEVILGLGSNAQYKGYLCPELLALSVFRLSAVLRDIKYSSVYVSKAMYVTDQDDFYNMVVRGFVDDSVTPRQLLSIINGIEAEFGRDRTKEIRFGPRSLDIDIEEFENQCVNEADLIIPHPRMKERAFVLIPMLEIFNEVADEIKRKELSAFLDNVSLQEVKKSSADIQRLFDQMLEKARSFLM